MTKYGEKRLASYRWRTLNNKSEAARQLWIWFNSTPIAAIVPPQTELVQSIVDSALFDKDLYILEALYIQDLKPKFDTKMDIGQLCI